MRRLCCTLIPLSVNYNVYWIKVTFADIAVIKSFLGGFTSSIEEHICIWVVGILVLVCTEDVRIAAKVPVVLLFTVAK